MAALLAGLAAGRSWPGATTGATPVGSDAPSPVADRPAATRPASTQSTAPGASPATTPRPSPSTPIGSGPRLLIRGAALATGRSATLERRVSVLVAGGRVAWMRPADAEEDPGPAGGLTVIEGRGLTIVPGMVDAHSHVVLPGGPDYVARLGDPPRVLVAVAEENGGLLFEAGARWLRDVGSPVGVDPVDGKRRGLDLGIRDRWAGRPDRPTIRAAGTWITTPGVRPGGSGLAVADPAQLPAAALGQLHAGADLVKLYVQAAGGGSPWTASEIAASVRAVHAAGARVAAHVKDLAAARAAVEGGVDAIDHGFEIDRALARTMAANGTWLVTTLTVPLTWLGFARTAPGTYYATAAGRTASERLLRDAMASARTAHEAGVRIAAGTDFGGGGAKAGVLAGEVEALVRAGLQPWEALGAATWRGGELLGEPDAGVIREGGPADLILVDGDPLSDPAALWHLRPMA
jgi:imidazolonepropionase-like amidohydrolase